MKKYTVFFLKSIVFLKVPGGDTLQLQTPEHIYLQLIPLYTDF